MFNFFIPTTVLLLYIFCKTIVVILDKYKEKKFGYSENFSNTKIFSKTPFIVWFSVVLPFSAIGYWFNNIETKNGSVVGVITKFGREGVIWKTWEGEVALEGLMSDGSASNANTWYFSIDRQTRHNEDMPSLVVRAVGLSSLGAKVKIRYVETLGGWYWRGNTSTYVQAVEFVNDHRLPMIDYDSRKKS